MLHEPTFLDYSPPRSNASFRRAEAVLDWPPNHKARTRSGQAVSPGSNPGAWCAPPYLCPVSEDNVEIVRRSLDRWSNGDLEGFLEGVDPEIEWRTSGIYPDVNPVYYGHEGFRQFWRDFHEVWETLTMELRGGSGRILVPLRRDRA